MWGFPAKSGTWVVYLESTSGTHSYMHSTTSCADSHQLLRCKSQCAACLAVIYLNLSILSSGSYLRYDSLSWALAARHPRLTIIAIWVILVSVVQLSKVKARATIQRPVRYCLPVVASSICDCRSLTSDYPEALDSTVSQYQPRHMYMRDIGTYLMTYFGQFWRIWIYDDSRIVWVLFWKMILSENWSFLHEGVTFTPFLTRLTCTGIYTTLPVWLSVVCTTLNGTRRATEC